MPFRSVTDEHQRCVFEFRPNAWENLYEFSESFPRHEPPRGKYYFAGDFKFFSIRIPRVYGKRIYRHRIRNNRNSLRINAPSDGKFLQILARRYNPIGAPYCIVGTTSKFFDNKTVPASLKSINPFLNAKSLPALLPCIITCHAD